ncbi:hypothetical protein KAFR_0F01860 [Kazachstania africana CBS 2517]|uniref:Inositol-3-phosphate synthase n=1 Tax=Kazachstania africana (strain ATCC 22294 / BCRC 22015 / CBS 2517 / CECT 1963 / NBRC 1671 / NRRL Y-8276) TaxID=1071382 RepID=H2AWN3_KAZAF|nr:hypothetical protein KAFR_0F01860 [Kazachstania africana CBS 2517]CCF58783.1 hypothetical protein KAFR_0F01860 [Kazachstania africana CBS 2517]
MTATNGVSNGNVNNGTAPRPSVKFNPRLCTLSGDNNELISRYKYQNSIVVKDIHTNELEITPFEQDYQFKINLNPNKVGIMLVGLGGNNGSTFLASLLANKNNISFNTREGTVEPNYYGSMTQSSTLKLGIDSEGNDVFAPFNSILPMVNPNDFVVSGWDINDENLFMAMQRAKVLEYDLQSKLKPYMESYKPLKSIYYPDFIAMNQFERANNCINQNDDGQFNTQDKWNDLLKIRQDIKDFKSHNNLENIIVLWTANTERCVEIIPGVNDTMDNLIASIKDNHSEISPSNIFATAAIMEKVPYINGSPQNTFVPGLIELAEHNDVLIAGDDFKTGQTKLKSVMTQFLVDAGIKPVSIASYNHLGNNDGLNLSSHAQFRSKEISKSSVIDDCINSNEILFNKKDSTDKTNHCIVIKYMKAVGDSKVAMDEYYSQLMLGGHNRISIHNVCEDSLLASPIIIDLLVMTEFLSRITYKKMGEDQEFHKFYPILSFLSYWLKAPLTRSGFKPINSLNRQRLALENFLRLLVGLPPNDELRFEERLR